MANLQTGYLTVRQSLAQCAYSFHRQKQDESLCSLLILPRCPSIQQLCYAGDCERIVFRWMGNAFILMR